jgi:hypothetical protein
MRSWKAARFGLVAMALGVAAGPARADEVIHFEGGTSPGQFPGVSTLLDDVGIGSGNVASETTVSAFTVPGSGSVSLTFKIEVDFGAFLYEFGFYDVSAVTADPIADKQGFAVEALSSATMIFDDRVDDVGATKTVTVLGGTTLGFFIVPNNTIAGFLADPDAFYDPFVFDFAADGGLRAPLFSRADANPGELDQFLSFVGNGKTLFTFEDLSRAGPTDESFTDLGFTVDAALIPVSPVPEPGTLLGGLAAALLGGGVAWRRRRRRVRPSP